MGKTIRKVIDRVRQHRNVSPATKSPVGRWSRKHGRVVQFAVVEEIPPGEDWQAAERKWIAHYRRLFPDLLNIGHGGEGHAGFDFTAEHRARISAGLTRGKNVPCEQCGTPVWTTPGHKFKRRFCGRACLAAYQRAHPRVTNSHPTKAIEAAAVKRREIIRCPAGHPYFGDNLAVRNGRRVCRECGREATRRYRAKIFSRYGL